MNPIVEVALFTDDVPALRAFYERLLGGPPETEWPGGPIFTAGTVKVLLHERPDVAGEGPPNEDHLAVGVHGLDQACEELRSAGSAPLVEPRHYPWGRSAYLRDPDGRLIELSEG